MKIRQFIKLDHIFLCSSMVTSFLLAHSGAANFSLSLFPKRLATSTTYLIVTMLLATGYCLCIRSTFNWRNVIAGAFIMLVTADVAYSIQHQETILVVFPALFCLPGAMLGVVVSSVVLRFKGAPR